MHLIAELNWQNRIGELEDISTEFIQSEQEENKL